MGYGEAGHAPDHLHTPPNPHAPAAARARPSPPPGTPRTCPAPALLGQGPPVRPLCGAGPCVRASDRSGRLSSGEHPLCARRSAKPDQCHPRSPHSSPGGTPASAPCPRRAAGCGQARSGTLLELQSGPENHLTTRQGASPWHPHPLELGGGCFRGVGAGFPTVQGDKTITLVAGIPALVVHSVGTSFFFPRRPGRFISPIFTEGGC